MDDYECVHAPNHRPAPRPTLAAALRPIPTRQPALRAALRPPLRWRHGHGMYFTMRGPSAFATASGSRFQRRGPHAYAESCGDGVVAAAPGVAPGVNPYHQ